MSFIVSPPVNSQTVPSYPVMASQGLVTAAVNPGGTFRFVSPTPFGLSTTGPGSIQIPSGQFLQIIDDMRQS